MASACNIEIIRLQTLAGQGDWSGVAVNDDRVQQLKQSVVNDAFVTKAHNVVESYQKVNHVTLTTRNDNIIIPSTSLQVVLVKGKR